MRLSDRNGLDRIYHGSVLYGLLFRCRFVQIYLTRIDCRRGNTLCGSQSSPKVGLFLKLIEWLLQAENNI